jgi:arylformamidase
MLRAIRGVVFKSFERLIVVRTIDLTGEIAVGAWTYGPPFPSIEIQKITKIEEIGYDAYRIVLADHVGTHIDAPSHFFKNTTQSSELSLDQLMGEAELLNFQMKGTPLSCITKTDFERVGSGLRKGDIAVVRTGWETHWNLDDYVTNTPHISNEAAEWLVERKVKLVAGDVALFCDPRVPPTELIPDKILLKNGIPYINGLVNLGAISKRRFQFIALPLKVKGVTGAPVRVVAIDD